MNFKTLTFLLASIMLTALLPAALHANSQKSKDIVEVASSADIFSTLVTAVTAADLASTLKGEGPFTIFAPTDEAFAKLPKGTLEFLLEPENKEKLIDILTYHVVSGKLMATNVKEEKVPTLNGALFTVTVEKGNVFIDNAKITKTDLKASNGVVHIIDSVILPRT